MRIYTLAFFAAASVLPETAAAAGAWEARRAQCLSWMVAGGYPSGLEEVSCRADFALPSAFLFKCARAQRLGYETELQKSACIGFFVRAARAAEDGYVIN